jgi:hypothetical protein
VDVREVWCGIVESVRLAQVGSRVLVLCVNRFELENDCELGVSENFKETFVPYMKVCRSILRDRGKPR